MSNKKGEIATILTIGSLVVLGLTSLASSVFMKKTIKTQPRATSCSVVDRVSFSPSTINAGQTFTCNLSGSIVNQYTMACGWSKNGGWPQGQISGNCYGDNCTFKVKMEDPIDPKATYELVGFDFRNECGPKTGKRESLNVAGSCPVPSSPAGLSGSCSASGTSATISWNSVSGAKAYALRIDDTSNGWTNRCDQVNDGDACIDNLTSTSYTFSTTPGHSYSWWVHSVNDCGWSDSDRTNALISCSSSTSTSTLPPGQGDCEEGKRDITGACNPACCDRNDQCPSNQLCNISNGYCRSGFSCSPNSFVRPTEPPNPTSPPRATQPSIPPPEPKRGGLGEYCIDLKREDNMFQGKCDSDLVCDPKSGKCTQSSIPLTEPKEGQLGGPCIISSEHGFIFYSCRSGLDCDTKTRTCVTNLNSNNPNSRFKSRSKDKPSYNSKPKDRPPYNSNLNASDTTRSIATENQISTEFVSQVQSVITDQGVRGIFIYVPDLGPVYVSID